jgi:hypothetical protein
MVDMLNKRLSPRRKMVLPIKVSIDRVSHLAHTIDITHNGARIAGLRARLEAGMTISLQRGMKKAKFTILWIRQLSPNELQAGIQALEPQDQFWGVDLADAEHDAEKDMQTLMTLLAKCSKAAM